MTTPAFQQANTNEFTQDLMRLMVRRGVTSIAPRPDLSAPQAGLLGLTEQDTFVTRDLAFAFLGPQDHRAAAAALHVNDPALLPDGEQRGEADIAAFSRAAGELFDQHGIMNLEFPAGAFLGFRSTPQGQRFAVEGVHLTLRPTPNPA